MHPSTTLIAWLAAVLSLQFLGYAGLAWLALGLLISLPTIVRPWLAYVRRARWLLLVLWLIMAYNTPGEAFQDFAWAPTYEGATEANLHVLRLLLMLGCLAWLFKRLGHDGLLSGLWGLLLPLRWLGMDAERLLVRLALVLENLQSPPERGAWKQMLHAQPDFSSGPEVLQLSLPAWRMLDRFAIILISALFVGAIAL